MTHDAFRQHLMLGDPDGDGMYSGEEELDEENQGHLLDEDDFVQSGDMTGGDGMGDMDADLDDEIPEADGGYEHTDSEVELSSSSSEGRGDRSGYPDEDDAFGRSMAYGSRTSQLTMGPPQSPTLRSRGPRTSSGVRHSLELSSILSHDDTSFMESSPVQGRQARQI